jgi:hypothetical protein
MAMKNKGHVRMVIYVSPEFKRETLVESKARKIPLGELVEEAFSSRTRLIRRSS